MEKQPDGVAEPQDQPAAGGEAPKKSRKKMVLIMALALVLLLIAAGLMGGVYAWRFLAAARSLSVNDVDLSRVPDGTYRGSFSLFHVKAAVEVRVEGGRMTDIALIESGRMAEETRQEIGEIFQRAISSQSLQVDISSGASVSKKVSLKAVEEALAGGE